MPCADNEKNNICCDIHRSVRFHRKIKLWQCDKYCISACAQSTYTDKGKCTRLKDELSYVHHFAFGIIFLENPSSRGVLTGDQSYVPPISFS